MGGLIVRRYDDIAVFLAVARNGSFKLASRVMKLPGSTVSRRISLLERRLGVQLLKRTTRRVSLTESGAVYADRCGALFDEIDILTDAMVDQEQRGEFRGRLRVTTPILAGAHTLGPWLIEFAAGFRDLHLELLISDAYLDLVQEGIDLAFRVGPLPETQHIARRLWGIPYVLCGSPPVVAESGVLVHPKELLSRRLIVTPPIESWVFARGGERFALQRLTATATVSDLALTVTAVRAGLGIAYLPRALVKNDLMAGALACVATGDWQPLEREMYVVYPVGRQLSAKVRAAVDYIRDRAAADECRDSADARRPGG